MIPKLTMGFLDFLFWDRYDNCIDRLTMRGEYFHEEKDI